MKIKIGIIALLASLLSYPMIGQIQSNLSVSGVGLSVDKLENDAYFKPKKKKKKKKKKGETADEYNIMEHLWYGANGTLGLGSGNGQSQFAIGLTPMVGYKLTKWLSAGPRIGLEYNIEKFPNGPSVQRNIYWQKSLGVFARIRFWNLFLHAEADQFWISGKSKIPSQTIKLESIKLAKQYIGLGWNEGRVGTMGYEFMILYDIEAAKDENNPNIPIIFRGGLTYNF